MVIDTCAIIVDVDSYAFAPLSSAVNDAMALRDALTAPGPGGMPPVVGAADVPRSIRTPIRTRQR